MKMILLAIFDVQAGGYIAPPIGAPTRGVGERSFVDEVNRTDTPMNRHPDDFELHEVGEFNMFTGEVKPVEGRPIVYGRARQFLRKEGE